MSILQLKTFNDIVQAVVEEAKIQASDTTQINRIKRDINIVYQHEVLPYDKWRWLEKSVQLRLDPVTNTGTAAVVQGSSDVTLSVAPAPSKIGYWFKVTGYNEVYKIIAHTTTSITLEVPFTGTSNSAIGYEIWTDELPLPVDCTEVIQVTHRWRNQPLEALGELDWTETRINAPSAVGKPFTYTITAPKEVNPYSTISGLPSLSTRASTGLIKTLVFSADVSSFISESDRIKIKSAGHYSYDGEFVVQSVSTTTITFTGLIPHDESATADTNLTVLTLSNRLRSESYRSLLVYPAKTSDRITLNVIYKYQPQSLNNTTDEPVVPFEHRSVLLYGALSRTYSRLVMPDEALYYQKLFQQKLNDMKTKLHTNNDFLKIGINKNYLAVKRASSRYRGFRYSQTGATSSGDSVASQQVIKSTPSRAAIFNADGELIADSLISTTELEYLDGVTSNIQTQFVNTWSKVQSYLISLTTNGRFKWDGTNLSITDDNGSPASSDAIVQLHFPLYNYVVRLLRSDGTGSTSKIAIADGEVLYVVLPDPFTAIDYSGTGTGANNFRVTALSAVPQNHTTYWLAYRNGTKLYIRDHGSLETNEEVLAGESIAKNLLTNLGLSSEVTVPTYTSAISGSLNDGDYSGTANEPLVTRIAEVTALHKDRVQDLTSRFIIGSFTWDGTNITASTMKLLFSGATTGTNKEYVVINDIPSTAMADGEGYYVTLNRTDTSTALTATKVNIESIPLAERNHVIIWRQGSDIYLKDN